MPTPTNYQQTRLDGMQKGFGLNVEPAQSLSGPELDQWLDAAEDELFAAAMMELVSMRVPVPAGLASLPPEPQRKVIVVSHGGSGRVVRGAYLGLPRAETLAQEVPQDAVFRLASGAVERIDCEVAVQ